MKAVNCLQIWSPSLLDDAMLSSLQEVSDFPIRFLLQKLERMQKQTEEDDGDEFVDLSIVCKCIHGHRTCVSSLMIGMSSDHGRAQFVSSSYLLMYYMRQTENLVILAQEKVTTTGQDLDTVVETFAQKIRRLMLCCLYRNMEIMMNG